MTIEILGYTGIQIADIIVGIANICILSVLISIYIKSYKQIKIGFTVGLMLFATVLLFRSVLTIIFLIIDNQTLLGDHEVISDFILFIALVILLKVTWDY